MLSLQTQVIYQGRLGKIIARTIERQPKYDLRMDDGENVLNKEARDFRVVG